MQNNKTKLLHEKVVDTVIKAKEIQHNHDNAEDVKLSFVEKLADLTFKVVSNWVSIIAFALFITCWIIYNVSFPVKYRFDPYPFLLLTFLLAGIAAIQAPVIIMTERRQNQKDNDRIARNLKVENEILTLHQSVTVPIEQQLQQVHESQLTTLKLLQELHTKLDHRADL